MASRKNFPSRVKARREGAYRRRLAHTIAVYGAKSWPDKIRQELAALKSHVREEFLFKGPVA